ncbi:PTS system N-acetylglucosamine-specific IIC component, Glc family (TC 4.A.1.1.5) [Streptoalloteichus tenebrarius]|uniref:PTS system N-acetylglucosamine-specific IIC component, Glc family (TC 4.A.1.1.5) n=1 Tax=Streptoalloteichus tenebrarius (strain ATCC 17920 / DSM 40477 / JCM 4838 / CBS 697.72 / NBRC 16177 / NCIMB 11028 / NRRL B-12390 / A12253. 1 / ISP 5477) TaxID=1933 RepID=A0ABT1HSD3_STRSD|nr:PTS transporter subunit EIIC [Streptoalloteichus tenebrarius]MCP2258424.1 PTS system N-acetylglucosamine-specific IIC component, Glc family (TC 4.A.1.1.5) [Streptoalloteichus tenebrarius]BFF03594.1 PTS transporter subunit EIIC [Streptoalloteichus tenebrarius]
MSANPAGARDIKGLAVLQRLGRSLMLPIAALPAAGLLLRLGQDDLLGRFEVLRTLKVAEIIGGAGGVLFDYLPLLFAVGVAIGFARKSDGSTALAAVVGYLVLSRVVMTFDPQPVPGKPDATAIADAVGVMPQKWPYGVLTGLIAGLVSAQLWQKYHRVKLPPYLAFFGGRRFVPIITAAAMVVLGVVLGLLFPLFDAGITGIGEAITGSAVIGGAAYGVINRLLLPFGLHHIINTFVWFVFGEFGGEKGDINRFIKAHDPDAGAFQSGFFPIFMFALPAAALAIWQCARPKQRKVVGGIMLSAALTSFLTGVTEPLEFSFMFVAWPLYFIHAFLTGTSHALMNALDVHTGFTFSAGAIDYVLNWGISTNAWLVIPVGLGYAVIYYVVFRFVIKKWNLRTPGREDEDAATDVETTGETTRTTRATRA